MLRIYCCWVWMAIRNWGWHLFSVVCVVTSLLFFPICTLCVNRVLYAAASRRFLFSVLIVFIVYTCECVCECKCQRVCMRVTSCLYALCIFSRCGNSLIYWHLHMNEHLNSRLRMSENIWSHRSNCCNILVLHSGFRFLVRPSDPLSLSVRNLHF